MDDDLIPYHTVVHDRDVWKEDRVVSYSGPLSDEDAGKKDSVIADHRISPNVRQGINGNIGAEHCTFGDEGLLADPPKPGDRGSKKGRHLRIG